MIFTVLFLLILLLVDYCILSRRTPYDRQQDDRQQEFFLKKHAEKHLPDESDIFKEKPPD